MAISIDWQNRIIYIPRLDLTLIQSIPIEIRELNLNWFRMQLKALEASDEGMAFPNTHNHNTEVALGGLTFARVIEIINNFTITFEDGQYAVNLVGANSNVGDRVNVNQVSVRSANSAGLISSPAIEFSSFNGYVSIDTTTSFSGTIFPTGTPQAPVNNLADAVLIAKYRGFVAFYIVCENITIDSGGNYERYKFSGQNYNKTKIFISDAANVKDCEFKDAEISGTLDGGSLISSCRIQSLQYIDGIIENSLLTSNSVIVLSSERYANIINCSSGRRDTLDDAIPIIDMGGYGTSLAIRNYNGAIHIRNKFGDENIDIDLNSGVVILNETVTGGTIQIRGIGELINNSTGTVIVDANGLMSKYSITNAITETIGPEIQVSAFNNCVTIDSTSEHSGTEYPTGTPGHPVNNISDAILIATERGFDAFSFVSDFIITSNVLLDNYVLKGKGAQRTFVEFKEGSVLRNCMLKDMGIFGITSEIVGIDDCGISDFKLIDAIDLDRTIIIQRCLIHGPLTFSSNFIGKIGMMTCYACPTGNGMTKIDVKNADCDMRIRDFFGRIDIYNNTTNNQVRIDLSSGGIILDSSVTGGNFILRGIGTLTDNSSSVNSLNKDGLINREEIVKSDWNIVYIDTIEGESGTDFPIGTSQFPCNNLSDAIDIANHNRIEEINFIGEITAYDTISNFKIKGIGSLHHSKIHTNSQTFSTVVFDHCYVTGIINGTGHEYSNCYITNITNLLGFAISCQLDGLIKIAPNNTFSAIEMVIEGDNTLIDLQNQPCAVSMDINSGWCQFINSVDNCLIELNLKGGEVSLYESCLGGEYYLEGTGTLFNESNMTVKENHLTWDEPSEYHTIQNSMADVLKKAYNAADDAAALILTK